MPNSLLTVSEIEAYYGRVRALRDVSHQVAAGTDAFHRGGGNASLSTCSCETLLLSRCGRVQLFALLAEHSSAAELDFVAFERQHFHQDLVALLQLVADVANAVLGDLPEARCRARCVPR